ncbi:MAG TPA: hypothetical protein VMX76_00520 [Nevskiaceae bacterium]|nr:hypothetical protein [Nevskiaceae bacterium]
MKQQYIGVIFTKHVINRLYNQGISQSDAWQTFQHPDNSLPGKTPGSRKFYKNFGDKRIEIVAKKNEKGEWVILTGWIKYPGSGQPSAASDEPFLQGVVGKLVEKGLNKLKKTTF